MEKQEPEQVLNFPEYMRVKYTEYDPLRLTAFEDGKEIDLMTYRYEVPSDLKKKGVIFFLHGLGEYCEHDAFIFKLFAEKGYESFAMDQRGFGNSGGLKGYQGTGPTIHNDIDLFIYHTIQKYNIDPKQTPLFVLGMSFGAVLSYNLTLRCPNLFKGQALVVPFFDLKDNRINKFYWIWKTFEFFSPTLPLKKKRYYQPEYYERYGYIYNDPKRLDYFRIQTLIVMKEEHEKALQNSQKQKTPLIMITAGNDHLVSNDASFEIFDKNNNPQNQKISFEESDHLSMYLEYDQCKKMVNAVVNYFDSLIQL